MSTRGLLGIKQKNGSIRYTYNHNDSYPAYLMKNIYLALRNTPHDELQADIESGEWNNSKAINITEIDYLWHEYVYVIDFKKKKWSAYQTKSYANKSDNKGKLMPIMEDIKFTDELAFLITKDGQLYKIIKVKKTIVNKPNYKILLDDMYYLVNTNDVFIAQSKKKETLLSKGISEQI